MNFRAQPPPDETPFGDVPDPAAVGGRSAELSFPLPRVERLPSPTRSELQRRWSLALAFCSAWLLGQALAFGVRANWQALPSGYLATLVGAPLVAAGICVALARARGRMGLGLRPASLTLWGVLALSLPLALGFGLAPPAAGAATIRNHITCVLMVLGWSVPPLLVLSSVVRRSFAAQAGLRSAHLAAAAGLLAAALANLHCALIDSAHVALAHGLPVTALALLGALFVAPRARS